MQDSINKPEAIWITTKEVMKIFGKSKTAVMYSLWKGKVWARQDIFSNTWLVEYWSCVAYFGKPDDLTFIQIIGNEIENGRPENQQI